MILPNPDKLNKFNKYALVMLAAKRARRLQEQGIARRTLVKSSSSNPLTIALEEIAVGRLIPSFNPEPLPELREPETQETTLTEGFEEAMARAVIPVEEDIRVPDNDNGIEEEIAEEDSDFSAEIDSILGLDEQESQDVSETDEKDADASAVDVGDSELMPSHEQQSPMDEAALPTEDDSNEQ